MSAKEYLTFHQYKDSYEPFEIFAKMILFETSKKSSELRDTIIKHFIAKCIVSLRSIFMLWESQAYQDCWILSRCIFDRLFYLYALNKDDSFEAFEQWSFKQRFDSMNKVLSDREFNLHLNKEVFKLTIEEKNRYNQILVENPQWRILKVERIAKEMNLNFLYKYGYDYASKLVHPMADDGIDDFKILLNLNEEIRLKDISVIHNSMLITLLILEEGLNASTLKWRESTYNFIESFINYLDSGTDTFKYHLYTSALFYTESEEGLAKKK